MFSILIAIQDLIAWLEHITEDMPKHTTKERKATPDDDHSEASQGIRDMHCPCEEGIVFKLIVGEVFVFLNQIPQLFVIIMFDLFHELLMVQNFEAFVEPHDLKKVQKLGLLDLKAIPQEPVERHTRDEVDAEHTLQVIDSDQFDVCHLLLQLWVFVSNEKVDDDVSCE